MAKPARGEEKDQPQVVFVVFVFVVERSSAQFFFTVSVRFKGLKKGGVTENASYYIFTQCPDGAFEAFPVHSWYNFTPLAKHRTLTAEEAEEEWGR